MVLDTDECAMKNDGCNQTCINEIGIYHCECESGYTLNIDGYLCDGMDQCLHMMPMYNVLMCLPRY